MAYRGWDLGAAAGRSGMYFVAKTHVQSPLEIARCESQLNFFARCETDCPTWRGRARTRGRSLARAKENSKMIPKSLSNLTSPTAIAKLHIDATKKNKTLWNSNGHRIKKPSREVREAIRGCLTPKCRTLFRIELIIVRRAWIYATWTDSSLRHTTTIARAHEKLAIIFYICEVIKLLARTRISSNI